MKDDRTLYARETRGTGWFTGIVISIALLAVGYLAFSKDMATQPEQLRVYLDPETGCQFVGKGGAIVPRFDADGKQLGCKDD